MRTEPEENPTPPAKKKSRLAVTSLVLALLSVIFLVLPTLPRLSDEITVFLQHFADVLFVLLLLCLVLAPVFGVVALIVIVRGHGQLVGKGFALTGIMLSVVLSGGLLFFVTVCVPRRVGIARASAGVDHLHIASQNYYDDYHRWPRPANHADFIILLNGVYCPWTGEDVSSTRPDLLKQNPRHVVYYGVQRRIG